MLPSYSKSVLLYKAPSDGFQASAFHLSTVLSSTELSKLTAMLPPDTKRVLLYKATRDGFQASAFHSRCDGIPNTVTVIRNNNNYVFGGFTAVKWSSANGRIADTSAFIFSLRRNGGLTNYKLPINSTQVKFAIRGASFYGPTFGGGFDINIINQSNTNTGSSSYISSYTPPTYPSGSNRYTFLTGGVFGWVTTEIEVYQLIPSIPLNLSTI